MSMTLTLDLPDEVAAALHDQAQAEGTQPEEVAEGAIIALLREKQPATLIGVAASVVAARDAELIAALRTSRA
jgi:hypothetical protein